jgi:hypothetical protein
MYPTGNPHTKFNGTVHNNAYSWGCVCVDAVNESALGAFYAEHGKVHASSNMECPQSVVNANA